MVFVYIQPRVCHVAAFAFVYDMISRVHEHRASTSMISGFLRAFCLFLTKGFRAILGFAVSWIICLSAVRDDVAVSVSQPLLRGMRFVGCL